MAKYDYNVSGSSDSPAPRGDKPAAQDVPVSAPRAATPFRESDNGYKLPDNFGKRKLKNQPKPRRDAAPREVDQQKISDLDSKRFEQREEAKRQSDARMTLRTGGSSRRPVPLHNTLTEKVDVLNTLGRPSGERTERWRTMRNPVLDESGQPKRDAAGNHILKSYSSLDEAKSDITAKRQAEAERRAGVAKSIEDANAPKTRKAPKAKKVEKAAKPAYVPKKVK